MTPRDRRAMVLGAGLVVAAFLGLRVLPRALRDVRDRRERLAAQKELLLRTRVEIRAASSLVDSAATLQRRLVAFAPAILVGRRESDAVADLARRVGVAATEQRVRLVRTVVIPDSTHAGRLRRVTVQASLEGDARGALCVLARLDAGNAVNVTEARLTAMDPGSAPAMPEVITSELVVRGWYITPTPSGVAP